MSWYYTQMIQVHVLAAWAAVGLFALRGLAAALGQEWGRDARLLLLVFVAHAVLLVTGLSLWVLIHYDPFRDAWLAAKLIALGLYLVAAHFALGRGALRIPAYALALLLLAYVAAVSLTRQALPGA